MTENVKDTARKPAPPAGQKNFAEHVSDCLERQRQHGQAADANGQPPPAPKRGMRGLSPQMQRLAKLDQILSAMGPVEAFAAVQWLQSQHGEGMRLSPADAQEEAT